LYGTSNGGYLVEKKYYYERSNLLESNVNITFGELLEKNYQETINWIEDLRLFVLSEWDNKGIPPTIGQNKIDIIKNFKKLREYNTDKFLLHDPETKKLNIIKNYNKFASGVNQFFPTMMKTRIGTTKNAMSIYDYFTNEHKEKFHRIAYRVFKKDSMYHFSGGVKSNLSAIEWIRQNKECLYFIVQQKLEEKCETLYLTAGEVKLLFNEGTIYKKITTSTFQKSKNTDKIMYLIKTYDPYAKIFPAGLQAFRLGLGQPAVNFPPLTAKWLYEHYTKHIPLNKKITVYDSSVGWGGRILGAMASHRKIHYIGTDPNTDNLIPELGISRYEYVAKFFNEEVLETNNFWEEEKNTFHIFQDGSELIGNNPDFQQYKNKVNIMFTSPPYFDRERYSEDKNQSFKAYPEYSDWQNNFLKPTLTTAVEYLKDGGYLLWNIANIKIGKDKYHLLEQDSIKILEDLGMTYIMKYKMLMTKMLGLRMDNILNSVKINGEWYKYEPIFVFVKK